MTSSRWLTSPPEKPSVPYHYPHLRSANILAQIPQALTDQTKRLLGNPQARDAVGATRAQASYVTAHNLPADPGHEYFLLTPPHVESCFGNNPDG